MAVQLGLRDGDERRLAERRVQTRGTPDRRRGERRRARLRSLLFAAMALTIPHQLKHRPLQIIVPGPHVTTTITSMVAVPPWRAYESIIQEAAALYRVSPALIRSVMQTESAFNPIAVSRTGAMGLMQLMPAVATSFGVENPLDPRENIMAGARLLRELLDSHHGKIPLTLASYNAGPAAVSKYRGIPPFRETRGYVRRVTNLLAEARSAGNND
jgi:soluble lytic murein transglycosylase-like protein